MPPDTCPIARAFADMVLREFQRALAPVFFVRRIQPKGITSGRRGQCLQVLAHGQPMTTGAIAAAVGITSPAAARSLRDLQAVGLARRVRRGVWVREEVDHA